MRAARISLAGRLCVLTAFGLWSAAALERPVPLPTDAASRQTTTALLNKGEMSLGCEIRFDDLPAQMSVTGDVRFTADAGGRVTVTVPASRTSLQGDWTMSGDTRVGVGEWHQYAVSYPMSQTRVMPYEIHPDADFSGTLDVVAAQDEYEAGSLVVMARRPVGSFTVREDDRPWVSLEERARMRSCVYGVDFQAGDPETDATRFYANPERTKWASANYDESKAGEGTYRLEDPLVFADGRKVANAADWQLRRREILSIFEREVYGRLPPKPEAMSFELVCEEQSEDRFSWRRTYRQRFDEGRTGPWIDWYVVVPRHAKGRVPVFLHMNYKGNQMIAEGRTNHYALPMDQLVARGYAFMSCCYTNVTSDPQSREEFERVFDGVYALWGYRDPSRTDNTGTLMAWAWAFMRGLDLAERIPEIDATRNVVIGSSRLGKAALIAGAYDERFSVVVPNQTGAAGVQLLKRDFGENARMQHLLFPHWYCDAYWKWEDDPRRQPFDQHLLLACVAPRALLLECYHKKWFDPLGEFLSARAAAPVWDFLTGKTLAAEALPKAYDETFLCPPFGYVTRTECHGLSPYDWKWAMDFADHVFRNGVRF